MYNLSPKAQECLGIAAREAARRGHSTVDTGHFLLSCFIHGPSRAYIVLESIGIPEYDVKKELQRLRPSVGQNVAHPVLAEDMKRALSIAEALSRKKGQERIEEHHILIGILSSSEFEAVKILKNLGYDPALVAEESDTA